MATPKVLVTGAVQGNLRKAFEKISKLHAKQDFSCALIVGDLFAEHHHDGEVGALLGGQIKVPLPTYFSVGDKALPVAVREKLESGDDICSNVTFLGRKGFVKTTEGIRIVAVGGRLIRNEQSVTQEIGKYDPLFLESEVKALRGAHTAHILLTNQWPTEVANGSKIAVPGEVDQSGAQCISDLCSSLKPRYHFSSSPSASWEREPFLQLADYDTLEQPPATRFRSLANVATSNKEWVSAFSLDPSKAPEVTNATASPFSRKRALPDQSESYSRYRGENGHPQRHKKSKRAHPYDPSDCFLCMGKPEFRQDMVVSIGEESFVSTLRGPLPKGDTFSELPNPAHVMIIPLYHAANETAEGERAVDEVAKEFAEMSRYRQALSKMVISNSKAALGTVCWSLNRVGIRHHHWQVLPARRGDLQRGLIDAAFKLAAERNGYPPFQDCDPDKKIEQRSNYFRVWFSRATENPVIAADGVRDGDDVAITETSMWFSIPSSTKFNIQLGREVMASLLKLEDRGDWRDTVQSLEDEQADADAVKGMFSPFDFAMD